MDSKVKVKLIKLLCMCLIVSDSFHPMDYSPPGPSALIFKARKLEWVLLQGIFPVPRVQPMSLTSPMLAGRFFTTMAA